MSQEQVHLQRMHVKPQIGYSGSTKLLLQTASAVMQFESCFMSGMILMLFVSPVELK